MGREQQQKRLPHLLSTASKLLNTLPAMVQLCSRDARRGLPCHDCSMHHAAAHLVANQRDDEARVGHILPQLPHPPAWGRAASAGQSGKQAKQGGV